ncbi:Splicing factor, arginine/serine-rich 16 [Heterocephalus glaber]|uniref:Splicing factor, arginine/serine-rich 16 n=1 Tax=Heterocephalus glaber TaxID=10181 RepID=G5CBM0_HETGA|nr:Splicing factor, arginine/serine-rich 16 [Heterocephalus glaber]
MWHEARKHERKLRGMMVDYKKRAERRREYYEKIKKDPAQFLQVHGRACKVHLDSAVALAAESPVNMMPWQGDTSNMIDRFDVRAHLDHIPDYTPPLLTTISPEQESDERKCNYERYRGLVQNDFAGISEQCLYQIYIDELYGGLQRPSEDEKKNYTYEDSTVAEVEKVAEKPEEEESAAEEESNSDEDEVIPDIDVEVDVDELNQEQVADLNKQATTYGMADGDFVRMLRKDKEEAEAIKHAKALEEEKAMYSGRRSRRQRREFREKRLRGRKISPPSYARRDSPTYDPYKRSPSESSSESRSRSRSPSPGREEKITFITSFGGSDEEAAAAAAAAASGATTGKPPAPSQPGGPAPGRNASARRRSSSSSSSSSSASASRTSSSRSSSRSRRGGGYYRSSRHARSRSWSRSRSRSRRYSRSRSRGRRHSGGGSRDGHRYSRSPTRRGGYGPRRRSRSRSRSGERYRRGGRGPRHHSSSRSRSSWSLSPSRSRSLTHSCSPSQSRSRSRSHSHSRSRSRSRSHSRSQSHSPSPPREKLARPAASPAVGEKLKKTEPAAGKETGAAKPKLTPQERLKLRMQKALNRQFKADKKAAQEKMIQQEHERQEREDELRAMARKIRMKERERREKEREEWERQYSRQSRSPSPRYSREYSSSRRRSRSRSRSPHYRH